MQAAGMGLGGLAIFVLVAWVLLVAFFGALLAVVLMLGAGTFLFIRSQN